MKTFDKIVANVVASVTIVAFFFFWHAHPHDLLQAYFGQILGQINWIA